MVHGVPLLRTDEQYPSNGTSSFASRVLREQSGMCFFKSFFSKGRSAIACYGQVVHACLMQLIIWIQECSPFSSAQQVKEFFKVVEHLPASLLIMCAQCIIGNRHLPQFSPLHTDSCVLLYE